MFSTKYRKHSFVFPSILIFVILSLITILLLNTQENNNSHSSVINYTDTGYHPDELFIPVGGKVTFVNKSSKDFWPASNLHPTHSLYFEFDPRRPYPPGSSWSFTFDKVGLWAFHDHLEVHQIGIIYVFEDTKDSISQICSEEIKVHRPEGTGY